jgi:hypothetical protein
MITMNKMEVIEKLARKLHSWYLEAVKEIKTRRIKNLEKAFESKHFIITAPDYNIKIIDDKLFQATYNPNAIKSFDDLSEDQQFIDKYITRKILEDEKNE